jgi:hypothetical protein
MSEPTFDCPKCKTPGATCVINNFFACVNKYCTNYCGKEAVPTHVEEEKTGPIFYPGVIRYPGYRWYTCVVCRATYFEHPDAVANGLRCPCGGMLHVNP